MNQVGTNNAKSVDNDCFMMAKNLTVMNCTDSWVDGVKFITGAVILKCPAIL